jgi:NAD(P)H-hydrate epimerase
MGHAVSNRHQLVSLLDQASVVVVGPGLGRSPWSEQLLQRCLESEIPMVIDADALNLVADLNWYERLQRNSGNRIITPHPGEAARLLQCSTRDVQKDRLQSVQSLRDQTGCAVVLKGCGSLLATDTGVFLSDYGNPGMASGGMGDVLSGILGALVAQSQNIELSLALGVCLHGRAAELAAEAGQNGLRATQLIPLIQELLGGH